MHIRWLVQAQCCFLISILNVFITLTGGHELLKRLFRYTGLCIIILYSPKFYGWVKIYVVAASVPFSRLKIVTEYENIQIDFRSELDMFSEFRVSNFRASP